MTIKLRTIEHRTFRPSREETLALIRPSALHPRLPAIWWRLSPGFHTGSHSPDVDAEVPSGENLHLDVNKVG